MYSTGCGGLKHTSDMSLPEVFVYFGDQMFGQMFDQAFGQVFDQVFGKDFDQGVGTS